MPLGSTFKPPKGLKLWEYSSLKSLPIPWPRSQDIQVPNKEPKEGDLLIILSMPWKYQMHPDPTGNAAPVIRDLIKQAANKLRITRRHVFIFEYFLSLPQFPLTEDEKINLVDLIEFLPELFLKSDAILHVEDDRDSVDELRIPGDGSSYTIEAEELKRCMLWQIDEMVQVGCVYGRPEQQEGPGVCIFDQVVAIGDRKVKSIHDLPVQSASTCCEGGVQNLQGEQCFHRLAGMAGLFDLITGMSSASKVELIRQKYGYKCDASVKAGDTGRIFFERFVSMVKVARGGADADAGFLYCNQKAIEQEIFEGSRKLKQATYQGPSALSAQLELFQKEFEEKKFPSEIRLEDFYQVKSSRLSSPDSSDSDAQLCQFDSKKHISNLMAAFLEETQIVPSLLLWRSVVEGDLDACLRSLKKKGNPNLSDESGRTCLYFAVQQRSIDLVRLLIEHKSSPRTRDHSGAVAGHWVPLFSDRTTVDLVEVLAKADPSMWSITNNAGVTAFERLYLWASGEGEPLADFKTSMLGLMSAQEVQKFEGRIKPSSELGPLGLQNQWSHVLETKVTVMTRQLNVNGKTRTVRIIRPLSLQVDHPVVLYFGFCRLLPWSLQEPALCIMAHYSSAEIFCIGCDAVKPELLRTKPEEFFKDVWQLIDILPLPDSFVLMDSSFGLGLPMLWKLKSRLRGALIINASWFFQASFVKTEMYQKLQKRAAFLSKLSEEQDLETLVPMLGDFCLAPVVASLKAHQSDRVKEMFDMYRAALSTAPNEFWQMCVEQPLWNVECLSACIQAQQDFAGSVCKIILASGSHAPCAAIHDSAANLQQSIFPDASCRWVPSSMWFWQIEGVEAVAEVAMLLKSLTTDSSESSEQSSHRLDLSASVAGSLSRATGFF
eukprot:TRINITY_DN7772_c0_g3_i2.p1 TRINITY_DN7772_c0_g3~~TRINITY_DN7772_c0_g3_i2.p1  ORF type:complete len:887 (+),score=144.94 TRINITY_DN7772_c0_g3_i2:82-2742(+)